MKGDRAMTHGVAKEAFDQRMFRLYGAVWLFLVMTIVGLAWLDQDWLEPILSEGGAIESVSAFGYFVCAGVLLVLCRTWSGRWHGAVVLTLMGLRELDFHARFTDMNISKIKFYLSPEVPAMQKVAGLLVVVVLLYALYRLARDHGRRWLQGLRAGQACAYGVAFAIACAVIAKSLDGFARKLGELGWVASRQAVDYAMYFEETLEMGIPLMVALSIYCYHWHVRAR